MTAWANCSIDDRRRNWTICTNQRQTCCLHAICTAFVPCRNDMWYAQMGDKIDGSEICIHYYQEALFYLLLLWTINRDTNSMIRLESFLVAIRFIVESLYWIICLTMAMDNCVRIEKLHIYQKIGLSKKALHVPYVGSAFSRLKQLSYYSIWYWYSEYILVVDNVGYGNFFLSCSTDNEVTYWITFTHTFIISRMKKRFIILSLFQNVINSKQIITIHCDLFSFEAHFVACDYPFTRLELNPFVCSLYKVLCTRTECTPSRISCLFCV